MYGLYVRDFEMVDRHVKIYDFISIMLVNIVCMSISMALATHLRYGMIFGSVTGTSNIRFLIQMIFISLLENLCYDFNHHFYRRGKIDELMAVIKEQFIFVLCMALWLYVIHDSISLSRLVFAYYVILDCILEFLGHLALKTFMEKVVGKSRSASRLLLLVPCSRAISVVNSILSYNEWYRTIVGVALLDKGTEEGESSDEALQKKHPNSDARIAEKKICEEITSGLPDGIRVVADSESFMDYAVHHEIDEVLIMDEDRRHIDMIIPWMQALEEMGITVNVNIDIFDLNVRGRKNIGRVGKYAVVTIDRNVLSERQLLAKRLLDICGSLAGCIVLGLVSIVLVPLIKLESPGPALFCQERVGKNGRIFTLYKFRSMFQDAEQQKTALMAKNSMKGLMFKMADDPRVTRVGKFIRKTSIDELPQFINILKGDMSLVGTRPPTVDEYRQYEAKHKCRLSMTPGLTGMWQVSGRSDITDFDDVVRLDMEYIDNWRLSKDIGILLKTVKVVFLGKGSR